MIVFANIVLAGGGVKGPVLAGCLKAAFDKDVKPRGFGGTSAGSIVAMLAAVGYTGDELKNILLELEFTTLLDDGGSRLFELKSEVEKLKSNAQSWIGGPGVLLRLSKFAFCTLGGECDCVFLELLEFFRTWASDG